MILQSSCNPPVDEPAKSESPVENGGKHPIIYRVEIPSVWWCRISQASTSSSPWCFSWLFFVAKKSV